MTVDQLLSMPDDGVDRELIRGELREKPMTKRNRWHAGSEARIAQHLANWCDQQPAPRGQVLSGEAGCIIRRDPDSAVGIDVVYISAETVDNQTDATTMIEGVPVLVVEILSPSDKQDEIDEKVAEYLDCGVGQVWIVNPRFHTVTVFRSDAEPVLYNVHQTLTGEPQLPGFALPLSRLFADR
jgi:Uma2 family endonuclease